MALTICMKWQSLFSETNISLWSVVFVQKVEKSIRQILPNKKGIKRFVLRILIKTFEPMHDKTYNKICVTRKDSDQPVHPPSMVRGLVFSSLKSPESVESTCDQRRFWSDCADAQADLSLRWSHKTHCRFCIAQALLFSSFWSIIYQSDCPDQTAGCDRLSDQAEI